jgi:hypothetical protein
MYFPDYGRGWVRSAARTARTLLEEHHFDVVITSGPPHSAHFAGFLATRGRSEPHWIDMRDPWSSSHAAEAPQDQLIRAERFLLSQFEKLLFKRAAKVLTNTLEFATSLRNSEPTLDVGYFPNGIDIEQLPARDPRKVRLCSVACLGTLYAGRNLSTFLAALGEVVAARRDGEDTINLIIAGPIDAAHGAKLREDIAAARVDPLVEIKGVIPRAQALDLLNGSHLALVLAQDQPMQVPAKLYECVGLGIATLVIAEETSAAAREGRRIGAMVFADNDTAGLKSVLNDLLDGRIPTRIEPRAPISYEELGSQMDRHLRKVTPPVRECRRCQCDSPNSEPRGA